MTVERILCALLGGLCLISLIVVHQRYLDLERSFVADSSDEPYLSAARDLFIRKEGATDSMIAKSFYVASIGFSDRHCIRFVPKPRVYGGATTYCFAKDVPVRAISVDYEAE